MKHIAVGIGTSVVNQATTTRFGLAYLERVTRLANLKIECLNF